MSRHDGEFAATCLLHWRHLACFLYARRYILYTDIDIIFTGNVTLDTFGVPLPKYFTMGAEINGDTVHAFVDAGIAPGQGSSFKNGNAGVMLLNTRAMRRVHSECVVGARVSAVRCEHMPDEAAVSNFTSQVHGMGLFGNQRGCRRASLWPLWAGGSGRAEYVLSRAP